MDEGPDLLAEDHSKVRVPAWWRLCGCFSLLKLQLSLCGIPGAPASPIQVSTNYPSPQYVSSLHTIAVCTKFKCTVVGDRRRPLVGVYLPDLFTVRSTFVLAIPGGRNPGNLFPLPLLFCN